MVEPILRVIRSRKSQRSDLRSARAQLLSHQKVFCEQKSEPWGAKCRAMFFASAALMGGSVDLFWNVCYCLFVVSFMRLVA